MGQAVTDPRRLVVAIDGGNSKTDVLVVDAEGTVLGSARGPGASPQNIGLPSSVDILDGLVVEAIEAAGLPASRPFAVHTSAYMAGLDFPREEEAFFGAVSKKGWAESLEIGNDTLALLRAGTSDGVGVAVVCGAGINAVGIGRNGRVHGFPALGKSSGDWGGGLGLGEEVLWWAARAEDGRGPSTALRAALIEHFAARSVAEVTQRLHFEELARYSLHALCPLLFRVAAKGDEIAQEVVGRFVEEISVMIAVILRKLELTKDDPQIVLGGGVLTGVDAQVIAEIERRILKIAPRAVVKVVDVAPVVGAALFGLDRLGADEAAKTGLRAATQRV